MTNDTRHFELLAHVPTDYNEHWDADEMDASHGDLRLSAIGHHSVGGHLLSATAYAEFECDTPRVNARLDYSTGVCALTVSHDRTDGNSTLFVVDVDVDAARKLHAQLADRLAEIDEHAQRSDCRLPTCHTHDTTETRSMAEIFGDAPALVIGQTDDLVAESKFVRVWRSRMTVADGAEHDRGYSVETRGAGTPWRDAGEYAPTHVPHFDSAAAAVRLCTSADAQAAAQARSSVCQTCAAAGAFRWVRNCEESGHAR